MTAVPAIATPPAPDPHVALRPVAADDVARIWEWNFAPEVRALSADTRPVTFAQHAAWFAARLAAVGAPFHVVLADHVPVGVVRIDPMPDGTGRISIALGRDARHRGIGRRAIALACAAWGRPVAAEIRPDNAPSRAAFTACGFRLATALPGHPLSTYLWRP